MTDDGANLAEVVDMAAAFNARAADLETNTRSAEEPADLDTRAAGEECWQVHT